MTDQVEKIDAVGVPHINMGAFVALIIGGLAIGTSPIFMRFAETTPTSTAFWRIALAIPLLILWQMYDLKKNKGQVFVFKNIKDFQPFLLVGFFFAADLIMWHWAVNLTTVANATLLANMSVIFTAVGGFLFFGDRFSKTFIIGLTLALLGAVSLMGHSIEFNPENIFGDLLGLTAAIAYAGYMIASVAARKKFSTASVMLGTAIISAIFIFPVAIFETGLFIPSTLIEWWPLIGLAWFTHVVGQSLIVYALAHLPAALGAVGLLIQPVVAGVFAWYLFAEALGIYHFVGAVFIISGILVCKKGAAK
ncbi:MAG: DMT family transporter [Kordiimonadaceae bacterium]|nr:DMT family transporter [Kordiimonadaceae bacterium]